MKYIRTKDGKIICYEVINETDMSDDFIYGYGAVMKGKKEGFEIEKIADTIEELCDEFVKKSKETWDNYFEIGEDAFRIFDRKYHKEDLEHYDYYGAIWTSKGLIYVAKMNSKGELELL